MSTQTKQTTTVEQATEALKIADATYGRFGYWEENKQDLLHILTADDETIKRENFGSAAERFRNFLWNTYSGGGTSANVTHKVFQALGRGDETDNRWI
jgi:hypothetical protein